MADERRHTEVWDVRAVTDDLSQRIWIQIQQRQRQLNTYQNNICIMHRHWLHLSRHLYRINSPAWCSRSARGCEWGWPELPGHQELPGPAWTDDWKKGPGSEEKTPNHGNIRLPVKRAERKQETWCFLWFLFMYINWSDEVLVQYLVVRQVELGEQKQMREGVGRQIAQQVFIEMQMNGEIRETGGYLRTGTHLSRLESTETLSDPDPGIVPISPPAYQQRDFHETRISPTLRRQMEASVLTKLF